MSKTVIQIVKEYLQDNGFDGLVCPPGECACLLGDLQPCGERFDECKPGYRHDDPNGAPGDWIVSTSHTQPKGDE